MTKYQFEPQDVQFLGYVLLQELKGFYQDEAPKVLANSRFLEIFSNDPLFVHHYDEKYWAEYIYHEYEQRKANERITE